jgi:hypothetical protein
LATLTPRPSSRIFPNIDKRTGQSGIGIAKHPGVAYEGLWHL